MKIFIGLMEISGYYKHLKQGFQENGIDCTFVNLYNHPFNYGNDDVPYIVLLMKKMFARIRSNASKGHKIRKFLLIRILEVLKIVFFIWALCNHDVFILGFCSSFFGANLPFFRHCELPVLRLFKKKIIFVFHGSDSRPPYIDGGIMAVGGNFTIEKCIELTAQKKKEILIIDKYADIVIDNAMSGHFHECSFVLGPVLGVPFEFNNNEYFPEKKEGIHIIHAPSHPEAKGTEEIRKSINNLKNKGYLIEFTEVIGKPNSFVLEQLAQCDIVVDQLYSDWFMPGFATEAAWFGKPVIIGGYAQELFNILPSEMIPPTYYCRPDEIEQAIEKLIIDEEYRLELGRRAKAFVKNEWTPQKVAERYVRLIKGDIPDGWHYVPDKCSYIHGWGLNEKRAKEVIRNVVTHGGRQALQLVDKPELEKKMLDFAGL